MQKTITLQGFRDEFAAYDRDETFSYEGMEALFDYLNECGAGELDVIALCCDFGEDSYASAADAYNICFEEGEEGDADDLRELVIDYMHEHTSVVYAGPTTILYAVF